MGVLHRVQDPSASQGTLQTAPPPPHHGLVYFLSSKQRGDGWGNVSDGLEKLARRSWVGHRAPLRSHSTEPSGSGRAPPSTAVGARAGTQVSPAEWGSRPPERPPGCPGPCEILVLPSDGRRTSTRFPRRLLLLAGGVSDAHTGRRRRGWRGRGHGELVTMCLGREGGKDRRETALFIANRLDSSKKPKRNQGRGRAMWMCFCPLLERLAWSA